MTRGDVVRVSGERGTFRVHSFAPDGSVTLWSGDAFRSVVVDRYRPTRKPGPALVPAMGALTRKRGTR